MKKYRVVGIGACVMDTLIHVPNYPREDTKMRALSSGAAGGGPTATGIVAAAKLGADSAFIGVLSDDGGGKFLLSDFEKYGVGTEHVTVRSGYRSFTSVIWLAADSATRTCVFDKGDLPPLALNDDQVQAVREADILMIDGNEMDGAEQAARIARESGTKVLYDCGGLYQGVERLLGLTDIMIPSEEFALAHTGESDVRKAAKKLRDTYHPEVVVITRGKLGGLYFDGDEFWDYPAFPVKAVDSNGAGDVFHGAFAAAVVKGFSYRDCCVFASATSAIKCMGVGARASVPDFDTVMKLVKEKGYEF